MDLPALVALIDKLIAGKPLSAAYLRSRARWSITSRQSSPFNSDTSRSSVESPASFFITLAVGSFTGSICPRPAPRQVQAA